MKPSIGGLVPSMIPTDMTKLKYSSFCSAVVPALKADRCINATPNAMMPSLLILVFASIVQKLNKLSLECVRPGKTGNLPSFSFNHSNLIIDLNRSSL